MHLLIYLAIATLLPSISIAANTCQPENVINMPTTGKAKYNWPLNWNENTKGPQLAPDQDCSWTVNVPSGYYAKLIISGTVTDNYSNFKMLDSAGNLVLSTLETKQPYYFPPTQFTLMVSNEAKATFAFMIVWAQIPTLPAFSSAVGSLPHLENATSSVFNNLYININKLSVLVFPQDVNNLVNLRSVLMFEANGHNDPVYVSNLNQVFMTGQQYVSSGSEIRLINLEARTSLDYVLIQQYDALKDFHPYQALECNQRTNCTTTIDGGKKQSAVVSAPHGTNYLVDVLMDSSATISIYYGSLTNLGIVGSYKGSKIQKALPIDGSYVMTYVISSGRAILTFSN